MFVLIFVDFNKKLIVFHIKYSAHYSRLFLSLRQKLRFCHLPRQREAREKGSLTVSAPRQMPRGFVWLVDIRADL